MMDTACNGFLGMPHHPGFSAYAAAAASVGGFGSGMGPGPAGAPTSVSMNHHFSSMTSDPFGSSSPSSTQLMMRRPGCHSGSGSGTGFFNGYWPTSTPGYAGSSTTPSPLSPSSIHNNQHESSPVSGNNRINEFRSSPLYSQPNPVAAKSPAPVQATVSSLSAGEGSPPSSSSSVVPPSLSRPTAAYISTDFMSAGSSAADIQPSAVFPPPPPPPGLTYGDMYQAASAGAARLFSAADLLQPSGGPSAVRLHEMYGSAAAAGLPSGVGGGLYLGGECGSSSLINGATSSSSLGIKHA